MPEEVLLLLVGILGVAAVAVGLCYQVAERIRHVRSERQKPPYIMYRLDRDDSNSRESEARRVSSR